VTLCDLVLGLLRKLFCTWPTNATTTTRVTSHIRFSFMITACVVRPSDPGQSRSGRIAARNHSAPNPYPNRCPLLKNMLSGPRDTPTDNLRSRSNALLAILGPGLVRQHRRPPCPATSDDGRPRHHLSPRNWALQAVARKPTFRDAFKRTRCLIPASGYYEWQNPADGKQPYTLRAVMDSRSRSQGCGTDGGANKQARQSTHARWWSLKLMNSSLKSTTGCRSSLKPINLSRG
jgi:SOS response associated peptidase (SRAP)